MGWHRLFVYGSLKRGFSHHAELRGGRFEKVAHTAPGYAIYLVGGYPALVPERHGIVRGEVYRVDAAHLARLDSFEGCPELYQRTSIVLDDGSRAEAYIMDRRAVRRCPRVEGQSWTECAERDEH